MGVFDNDLTLPGAITDIQSDYNFGYDTSLFGTTDSETIIGTSFNGPVGVQVPIYSPEHARYIFGKSYDSVTRKEATLVAEIEDAWNRGCRTIYAVRVSGKPINKDFQFAYDTTLKLRVSGLFPSNSNKDIYMSISDRSSSLGNLALTIFKPATRATIQEKMLGLVEKEEDILSVNLKLETSYGLTESSRVVDLIKIVNEHLYNNVLRLSIVDENGNDVTSTLAEAQSLPIEALFSGVYFIGRDNSTVVPVTLMDCTFIPEEAVTVSGAISTIGNATTLKSIVINTDINEDLPIYAKDSSALNTKFAAAGVAIPNPWDVLVIPGKVDDLFIKDKIDYEEVNMSDFELYKKLGSGFAITAALDSKAFAMGSVKVKEAAADDANRIMALEGGIYSMLENLKSDYRVLTNAVADRAITSKFPKKEDFKVAVPVSANIFDGTVKVTSIVDSKDFTQGASYQFKLTQNTGIDTQMDAVKAGLMVDVTAGVVKAQTFAKRVGYLSAPVVGPNVTFKNGSLFLVGDFAAATPALTLMRYHNNKFLAIQDPKDLPVGQYYVANDLIWESKLNAGKIEFVAPTAIVADTMIVVDDGDSLSVYKTVDASAGMFSVDPICPLKAIFEENYNNEIFVVAQNVPTAEVGAKNTISIVSSALDYTTLTDFIDGLNASVELNKLFKFSIGDGMGQNANTDMVDLVLNLEVTPSVSAVVGSKTISYDTTLYIPYKTTDNFARHLAQHCTYTSLKTAPTHGVLGVGKLIDVNLNSVANKVDSLVAMDTEFYAKKPNGNDMLDRNNMPYPIGRNISIVVGQYVMNTTDNYNYVLNAASGYAGMVSVLPLDQSSTNQSTNIPEPMYELNNYQLEKLTAKGFVTFKRSYTKGWVVTDGVTMAPVTSPFRRLSTTRVTNSIEEIIRAAVEPFIGKPNNPANRNSMTTSIKSALNGLVNKLISSFDFKLNTEASELNLGIVDIDYTINTLTEIRQVRNRITVKESV